MGLRANVCLREILIVIACKLDLNKSTFLSSGTIRDVGGESTRKGKDIFKVTSKLNEEFITSFNKILTLAQYPFIIGMLKQRI